MIKMDNITAVELAEGIIEGTEEELKEAWQHLVDTGLAWSLQGRFGRIAHSMIEDGFLKAPKGWGYNIDTIG
jgi:hypothetical protein